MLTPMESRWWKLAKAMRLTAGVLCCLVAVGLSALWVASYRALTHANVRAKGLTHAAIIGIEGVGNVSFDQNEANSNQDTRRVGGGFGIQPHAFQLFEGQTSERPRYGFVNNLPGELIVVAPISLLVASALTIAWLCFRLPRHFTVRGMLIATTVVAVVCGLIASGV